MASDVFGIVGTTVAGAFHVEAVVAEGGFAVIYRAHHAGFRAPVALKCLKIPQYFSPEEQRRFQEQFQAEAELLFKLSASIPNIVRPLHVEAVRAPDGSFMPFLALEWLEGETLDSYVRNRLAQGYPPPGIGELVQMMTPVARALDRAHHFTGPDGPVSIVHRDLKPENVFLATVAGEAVIKILDFGIARAKSWAQQAAGRTSQNEPAAESFTPAYGAPEQWMPKRLGQTGPWTDVWGLALTLVETLAGRPIIDGDQAAMMGAVLDEHRRPTPRTEGVPITDAAEAVFLRALAVDPRGRYQDIRTFWNELLRACGFEALDATRSQSGAFQLVQAADGTLALAPAGPPPAVSAVGGGVIPDLEVSVRPSPSRAPAAPPAEKRGSSGLELDIDAGSASVPRGRGSGQWRLGSGENAEASLAPETFAAPAVQPRSSRPPSRPPPSRGSVPPHRSAPPHPQVSMPAVQPVASIARRFAAPIGMIAAGVLITVADGAYAAASGEVLHIGPVRPVWMAAVLVLVGIGFLVMRLLPED